MMADESRVVGKHTLESLTVGMYADNRIIFREYVQNATDAIDKAIAAGIIKGEGRIDITIDVKRREIRIRDNGIGIPTQDVYHTLGDIGKSEKSHTEDRGFRGIGRLGGLGYCTELQFITSYQGEDCKTITHWNAEELRRLLQPSNVEYESIIDVVDAVTIQETRAEKPELHYFEVILAGIEDGHDNLLNIENIQDYLSQVAPVPFNYNLGIELQKINQKFKEIGKEPEEFKVFLNAEQIYKPYRRQVSISDKKKDFIKDITFFKGYKNDGSLFFLGWYGVTDLSGMVKEENINGLRVRKRNILIGDSRTLDEFFGNNKTYQNFNRWFVGEIYVFDENLIPNARRDDFEKNEIYFAFKREIEKTTHKLARLPHPLSKIRSSDKKIQEIPQKIREIQQELSTSGITETRRDRLIDQVDELKKKARQIDPNAYTKIPSPTSVTSDHAASASKIEGVATQEQVTEFESSSKIEEVRLVKENLLGELEKLESKIETSTNYTAKKLPSTISRICRKEIDKIFNVIDRVLNEGLARELKDQIIAELQPKGKEDKHK
jgi:molecular chaperone HtpG